MNGLYICYATPTVYHMQMTNKQYKSTPHQFYAKAKPIIITQRATESTFVQNKYFFRELRIATRLNRAPTTYDGKFPLYMIGYVSAKMFIMAKIGTAYIHIGSDVSGNIFLGLW